MSLKDLNLGENIHLEIKRKIATISIDRPEKANSITYKMFQDIKESLQYCQDNKKIRVIIITGTGESFTTGMDVKSLMAGTPEVAKEIESIANDITNLIFNGKPVISAINGKAMGDGVIYSLASDYRIAVQTAYFQMPEINLRIFPGTGCLVLMSRVLGIVWTKRILMFAEKISSEKAHQINLIDEIVENEELLWKKVNEKAKFLVSKDPTLLKTIKLTGNHLGNKSFNEANNIEKMATHWFEYSEKKKFLEEISNQLF